ncbi:F0F1 ATP synthase subunit A [Jiangella alkaliphila]|uniref:ATP synthase subunit a n=1 Tax=Jiangella alkaliphila TaxID=419479 RepID=A0A1H2JKE7_9ACTN|nr:F0F1 ATP synthase subunit A [Jiangella alkaliphila]SDU56939.1 ATP synthase F0 subcomplex A subunit [Jiangella alkaliphila]
MSTRIVAESGFHSPGPADFEFPPLFGEGTFFTKPMLVIVLGTIAVGAFFYFAARRSALVPGKLQFAGEAVYGFVRDGIARDAIGREGIKYVPYLVTLFSFIAVLNISGIIPVLQLPATSKIAIPLFLALISWVIYNYVGIKRQGFGGYFKNMMFPPGVPKAIYPLLAPLEFFSTFIVRPFTLTLRLTFNMFAGHLVLLLTILGGEYLITEYQGVVGIAAGSVSILFSIVLTFFEAFVQILQAYVFVLLSAIYIGGALSHEH